LDLDLAEKKEGETAKKLEMIQESLLAAVWGWVSARGTAKVLVALLVLQLEWARAVDSEQVLDAPMALSWALDLVEMKANQWAHAMATAKEHSWDQALEQASEERKETRWVMG